MPNKKRKTFQEKNTSWERVSTWYDKSVGTKGHYYHQAVILPHLLPLLSPTPGSSLLDLGCGQGVLSRHLPPFVSYVGVDLSPSLLASAKEQTPHPNCQFLLGDITKPLALEKKDFTLCTIVLALQNVHSPLLALKNAARHLAPKGKLFIILNHPAFRIPKHSSWGITPEEDIQYRRVDRYLSTLKIPIQSKPSLGKDSPITFSFHHPLSLWTNYLKEAGFWLDHIEEWCSDKVSTGRHAEREDLSRREIPLFLTLCAEKKAL